MEDQIWVPLSVMFGLGLTLRLFSRASQAYRSKLRTYPTRWAFVRQNWDVFLIRALPDTGLFVLWMLKPGLLAKVVGFMGVPMGVANWMTVPPTLGTAIGFGYFADLFLDKLQLKIGSSPALSWLPDALKGEVPSYDESVVNVQKALGQEAGK